MRHVWAFLGYLFQVFPIFTPSFSIPVLALVLSDQQTRREKCSDWLCRTLVLRSGSHGQSFVHRVQILHAAEECLGYSRCCKVEVKANDAMVHSGLSSRILDDMVKHR